MDILLNATLDQLDFALKVILGAGAALGFIIGLKQYAKAQTWKRREFVAAEVKEFTRDHLTRNAMLMIDWGTRSIELFPTHDQYDSRHVLVTRPALHQALVTHNKIGRPYTPAEAAIRDSFDAFFARLERFEHFIAAGLVRQEEFEPHLKYWIRAICHDANPELRDLLAEYVSFYRFDAVPDLFRRFGEDFGSKPAPPTPIRLEIAEKYDSVVAASQDAALAEVARRGL